MSEWTIGGVVLDTLAFNIEEISSGVGVPGRRGENIVLPYRDGARHVRKPLEERELSLSMWVRGTLEDGKPAADPRAKLFENMDKLFALFGKEDLQLVQRVMPDGSVRQILGEFAKPSWFVTKSYTRAVMTIDLKCPDPYWQGEDLVEQVIPLTGTTVNATVNNVGTATSRKVKFIVTGTVSSVKIENLTTETWVRYGGAIAGETLVIDSGTYKCTVDDENMVGLVSHAGDPAFLVLASGENSLKITCESTVGGSLKVEFHPLYF